MSAMLEMDTNIVLSPAAMTEAARRAKHAGFDNPSAYLEHLFDPDECDRDDPRMTEDEVVAAVDLGLADIAAGRTSTVDEVFDRLIAKYKLAPGESS